MTNAIVVQDLTRDYNGLRAVDGITFGVSEGQVFGYLGPNGAGKTTTIKMLTGHLRPTSGRAWVAGCDIVDERDALKPQIGVVFEHQNIYERLNGRDNLVFAARLYGAPRRRVDQVLELVGLADRARTKVKNYSNGMKQRLLIGRALLHEPRVLFLDEPTRGLDPNVARNLRALVRDLADGGVTVFLTTHYMEEADTLSDQVAILDNGSIVALGTPAELKAGHGDQAVQVVLREGGEMLTLSLENEEDRTRLSDLTSTGQVLTMHTSEATLEDVFVGLTGRSLGND